MKMPPHHLQMTEHRDYRPPRDQGGMRCTHHVRCELCTTWTDNTGTKHCDRCYGLKIRVEADPVLAQQIIDNTNHKEG